MAVYLIVICDLANQALLARVDIPIYGAFSSLKNVIAPIKWSALKGADPQIDIATSHLSQTLDRVFHNELNLFTINPPPYRMTLDVNEMEDQNLFGPKSNMNCINMGEM